MTRIKICGITNIEDALNAVVCGADALGFIFVENTPRFIGGTEEALRIPSQIPPFVSRVAVYSDIGLVDRHSINRYDCIQFYEDSIRSNVAGKRLIRAVRLRDQSSLNDLRDLESDVDAVILDAYHPEMLGGTGERPDWDLAAEAVRILGKPAILAGGLTPENVQEAILKVRPYAVDVSSGVESEPGRKDPEKVRRFIESVREHDRMNKGTSNQ